MIANDPVPVLLAFLVGLVLGVAVQQSSAYYKAKWWLIDRTPVRCPRCKTWHIRRNMKTERHSAAGWVRICEKCHDELYTPSKRS